MSPNGSVSKYRLPCFRTWTLPRSVAFSIGTTRGSTNATPPSAGAMRPRLGRRGEVVVGGASAGSAIAVSIVARQSGCLVGHHERVDQPVDVAVHHLRQRGQVELDPVVRDPVLGEVVGPDLVGAIAATDHRSAGGGVGFPLLLQLP